jgi:hypothetical protein
MEWTSRYFAGLRDELNKANGFMAIGGVFFAFIGVVTAGLAQIILIALGGVIVLASVVPALVRAIPKPLPSVADCAGQELNLATYRSLHPRPPAIGITGVEEVGKTALKNYLLHHPQQHGATQRITARITATLEHPDTYVAIVDGPGDTMNQQFKIADVSDILLVLLDHNIVPGQTTVAPGRLDYHRLFGRQLRSNLMNEWQSRSPRVRLRVHILLNKRDEWQKADTADQAALRQLLADERDEWKRLTFVDSVSAVEHANTQAADISALANSIKEDISALPQFEED